MFSKSGLASSKLHSTRVTAHWAILLCAAVAHGLGFTAIYYNKELNDKPHFTSWHGIMGLAASGLLWLQLSAGIFIKYPTLLKTLFSLKLIKACHGLSGTLTYTVGMIAMLLSFWSLWFQKNAPEYVLYFALLLHLMLLFIVCRKFISKYGLKTK